MAECIKNIFVLIDRYDHEDKSCKSHRNVVGCDYIVSIGKTCIIKLHIKKFFDVKCFIQTLQLIGVYGKLILKIKLGCKKWNSILSHGQYQNIIMRGQEY